MHHLNRESVRKNNEISRRHAHFKQDYSIPNEFASHLNDYIGTGYDRGHLAPAADFQSDQEAMNESFLLTNMSPQVANGYFLMLNQYVYEL